MNELAELAKLDKLVGGKKEEVTMESAMSNNEKIRDWVSHIRSSVISHQPQHLLLLPILYLKYLLIFRLSMS
jgi:hypothetical protein